MSDYILARKSRNIASSMVHILLNLLLGIGAVVVTMLTVSPLLGILLVVVSKWRIFAVRPRFIMTNLKANLVDLIVGISVVLLTYYSGSTILPVDFLLAGFYCLWLLWLKPQNSELFTQIQSLVAVFFGITAATIMSAELNSVVLVVLSFLIGYAASRHILLQTNAKDFTLTTLVGGLFFAEIALLCHSWLIIYTFGNTGIRIPQLAIILTIFAFVYNYIRQSIATAQEDFRFKDILAPIIFGVVTIAIIILGFSNPIFNV